MKISIIGLGDIFVELSQKVTLKKQKKKLKDQSSMSKIQIEKCHKANRAIDKNKHTLGTHHQEIQDPIYKLKKIKR